MSKRTYSDEEKANALLVLDAKGGNLNGTARETGIPRKTLAEWAGGRIHPDVAHIRQGKRLPLADRLEEVAHVLIGAIPGKVEGASLRDVAVSAAIALDKMRLLREQPTAISRTETHTDAERADRILGFLERGDEAPGTRPAAVGPPAVH